SSQAKCFVFTKQKIIWYQQTWHTIEFSNNKHYLVLRHPQSGGDIVQRYIQILASKKSESQIHSL
ncbi:hypothetical protein, partial [Glutamicibacter sp. NPDC087344]|uniref:hypothetical protein n=1 Tax=Glutamicibacter sp. NPDC087344 TaxID=3363994 RepID=UPI003821A43F